MPSDKGSTAKILSLVLLLSIISLSNCSLDTDEPSDFTLKSSKCSYLEREDQNQDNAFIMNNRECCMCPQGYKYVGICNQSHPNSTQCEPCRSGTYVHYGPHLQKKCYLKKKIDCPPTMVYYAGSTTEEDSCICPPGTRKISKWCASVPALQIPRTTQSTLPSTSKRPSWNKPKRKLKTKSEPKGTLVERIITASAVMSPDSVSTEKNKRLEQSTIERTMDGAGILHSTGNNDMKDVEGDSAVVSPDDGGSNQTVIISVVVVVVAISLLIGVLFIWKKCSAEPCQNNGKDDTRGNSVNTSNVTTPSSYRSLLGHENQSEQTDGGDFQAEFQDTSEGPTVPNSALPIREERYDSSPAANLQERLSDSCGTNREEHDCSRYGNNPQGREAHLIVVPALDVPQPSRNHQREMADRNEKFARRVAQKFGNALPRNDAMPLFREILDNDNDDQEFEAIYNRYEYNPKEMTYQLMLTAIRRKGSSLTPDYLLEKVKAFGPQTLVEIVEEEMKNLAPNS